VIAHPTQATIYIGFPNRREIGVFNYKAVGVRFAGRIAGDGTVFSIVLRASEGAANSTVAAAKPAAAPVTATGPRRRILVVDDEPSLCATIERILSRDHDVTAITSAKQALKLIEGGERFDAILSDLMMPEMTGPELYGKIGEAFPDQAARMIFMTLRM